jgi:serine protease inhibitor
MKRILIITLLIVAVACKKSETDIVDPASKYKVVELPARGEMVISSSNEFGLEIFRTIVSDEPVGKNIFISPTSLSLALSMTWNGAADITKDSMAFALRMPALSDTEINSINQKLIHGLVSADQKVTLTIANSIWYKQDFEVEQNFIEVNRDYYDAEVSALDFSASNAKDIINTWVENKTNGKIKDLIDEIKPTDLMYLIDAIYFKGTWKIAFDKDKTADALFTLNDGSQKTVRMMNMKDTVGYFENDLFQAVELDYGAGNFSMLVFLPKNNHVPADILSKMTPENWQNWISSFSAHEVGIQLPKFKFDYDKKLNDILSEMGMGIAFSDNADFTRINSGGNLKIDLDRKSTRLNSSHRTR